MGKSEPWILTLSPTTIDIFRKRIEEEIDAVVRGLVRDEQ